MAPKKLSNSSKLKRKVVRNTTEVKKLKIIIAKHESLMNFIDLAVNLLISKSTICVMLKSKDVIKTVEYFLWKNCFSFRMISWKELSSRFHCILFITLDTLSILKSYKALNIYIKISSGLVALFLFLLASTDLTPDFNIMDHFFTLSCIGYLSLLLS